MRRSTLGIATRWAFWLGGLAIGAAGLHWSSPLLDGGSLAVGQAPFLIDRLLPTAAGTEYSEGAAMVHDSRRHFGWKE